MNLIPNIQWLWAIQDYQKQHLVHKLLQTSHCHLDPSGDLNYQTPKYFLIVKHFLKFKKLLPFEIC